MHSIKNPSQYLTDHRDMVVNALQRIGRYVLGTMDEGLRCKATPDPWCSTSLRTQGDESTLVPRAFFQWNSAWSIPVASGSMESEIYAVSAAIKGGTPKRGLIGEIGQHDGKATSLSVDSSSSTTVL
jgi:hypothetical protein